MIDISGSSVCYKCNDRYVGCHGKCDRYLQEVAVNNEEKKAVDNYISIYAVKTREKCLRKYGHTYVKVR